MYHSHLGKDAVKSLYRNDVEFAAQEYVLQGLESKRNLSGDYFLLVFHFHSHGSFSY